MANKKAYFCLEKEFLGTLQTVLNTAKKLKKAEGECMCKLNIMTNKYEQIVN